MSNDANFLRLWLKHFASNKESTYLDTHPNLSVKELSELVTNGPTALRVFMAGIDIPESLLEQLLEDPALTVRIAALGNANTSFSVFEDAVFSDKNSFQMKRKLSSHPAALASLKVFQFLWNNVPGASERLVGNFSNIAGAERKEGKVFVPSQLAWVDANVARGIRAFIVSNILSSSIPTVMAYASSLLATPETLDELKTNHDYDVLEMVALNPRAWVSTHRYLVENHKKYTIRQNVARTTPDNILLNEIYNSTQSYLIRDAVKSNPRFVPDMDLHLLMKKLAELG